MSDACDAEDAVDGSEVMMEMGEESDDASEGEVEEEEGGAEVEEEGVRADGFYLRGCEKGHQ